jgi:spore coat protein CotH
MGSVFTEVLPAYTTPLPRPCPTLYDPDILPEFSIEISSAEWMALQFEYNNGGYGPSKTELKPYHPLDTFEYDGEVITNAEIRLKGWPGSYVDWGKMQFVIRFNGVDSAGRFQGLRRLALDSPYYEDSLLRERLSLTYFHQDLGLPGSCVNSARLVVNGQYYGLYTNIEYPDEELLERLFGNNGPDEGYLYKYIAGFGWKLKEGGEEDDLTAIDELFATYELGPIQKIIDVEHHLRFAAAEAVLPNEDNYFVGSINYVWYQHPSRGWMLLPWDHDWSFYSAELDPRDPPFSWLNEHLWVLVHSPLSTDYDIALKEAIDGYDPALFSERLQRWAAQVRPSANADFSLPIGEFDAEVARLDAFFWERQEYLADLFSE